MNLVEYKRCLNQIDEDDLVKLEKVILNNSDLIILGNGGSNAISCHIAQDYTKKLGKRALCFGDSSRMSCYANDYGWDDAYAKFIEDFRFPWSVVILISSSGNSQNILNAAELCKEKGIPFIILSGFDQDNKLRTRYKEHALIDFYVNSHDYGIVECLHELILHSIL